jgi:hypothetical protein
VSEDGLFFLDAQHTLVVLGYSVIPGASICPGCGGNHLEPKAYLRVKALNTAVPMGPDGDVSVAEQQWTVVIDPELAQEMGVDLLKAGVQAEHLPAPEPLHEPTHEERLGGSDDVGL